MRMALRLRVLGTLAVAGALALSAGPAIAAESNGSGHAPKGYACTGGEIPSGHYSRIMVNGACAVAADAVIRVDGNVNVAAGAVLDAQSAPSKLTVGGNVIGGEGSTVGLGCQPPSAVGNSAHPCELDPEGQSTITVHGNVLVTNALLVALNGITVHGNVRIVGGGGENYWSIKNNTICGNLTVQGQTVAWIGVMFNQVSKSVRLADITVNDEHPDAPGVFVVRNTIERHLRCMGLVPGVSGGFDPTAVNVVGGRATGQCAALV